MLFVDVLGTVSLPVLVGSGVTTDNMSEYFNAAGVIVGSHLKTHGHWHGELDPIRLNHFMKKVNRLRQQEGFISEVEDIVEDPDMDEDERLKARIEKQGE